MQQRTIISSSKYFSLMLTLRKLKKDFANWLMFSPKTIKSLHWLLATDVKKNALPTLRLIPDAVHSPMICHV